MTARRPIVYYVTAHGYGHGVRSCDIMAALAEGFPKQPVQVVSGLPAGFFEARLPGPSVRVRQAQFDVGLVQHDSIRADVGATLLEAEALLLRRDKLMAEETAFLRSQRAALVVADVPGLPLAAAQAAGIPGVAVGNFSWDWIYAPFCEAEPRWRPIVEQFREDYRRASLLLRLPFHGDMSVFPEIEDIPLVARPGRPRRSEIAAAGGLDETARWALLSFTSLLWNAEAVARVARIRGWEFLTMAPLGWDAPNLHKLNPDRFAFTDVVASVDAVITKPGFGIVSECIVNAKPIVYADRTDFVEYPVLVAGINRHLRHAHIPAAHLYAGDLAPALTAAAAAPAPPERLAWGGAPLAAARLAERAS